MRVLFLQKRAGKAGAQVCLAALTAALQRLGVEARVLAGEAGWLTDTLRQVQALAGIVPFPSPRAPLSWAVRFIPFWLGLRRLERGWGRPELVHANDLWEALLAEQLARRWRRPWLVHLRTVAAPAQLVKYHLPAAAAVIAVSPALIRQAAGLPPISWFYLPDGLDAGEFFPRLAATNPSPQRLGVVGHDAPAKGWEDVGQAFRLVQEAGGQLPQEIIFFGRALPTAQARLRQVFPASIRLTFAGLVTEPLAPYWRQLDLVLVPSRQESFGRTALEVIAAGVPVLASRTGIIPWVLGPDSPWTFAPGDPADLAATWQNLPAFWTDRENFLASWRQRLREEFLLDRLAGRLHRLYLDLAERGGENTSVF